MRKYIKSIAYSIVFAGFSCAAHADAALDFFRAVRADNVGSVQRLIERGVDPNQRDESGQTGLTIALREPSPKVVDALIASPKVNVEARNSKDESPLMLAALKGQQDVVKKLIARDADVNKPGWAPLHYAATSGQVAIIKLLLDNYAFIDAQSPNGTTPLMMAAMYGSPEAVKLLIDEGADLAMKNEQGLTALEFAKRAKRPDAVALLSRTPTPPKRPADGKW